jgi:sensor c-di-GMP phosphodiesterase-like protein
MNRRGVIVASIVFALIGAAAPIAASLYFSRLRAVELEHERLLRIADRGLSRAGLSFSEVGAALRAVDQPDVAPCSDAHIALMRKITVDTRSVDEIGYLKNGLLKCTSWGVTATEIRAAPEDFVTPDGLRVTLDVHPMVSHGKAKTELRYKDHNALIDPVRFADVIIDNDVQLVVGTSDGKLLGTLHGPDMALVQKALRSSDATTVIGDKLIAIREQMGLKAVVIEARANVLARLHHEQFLMLPFGIVMGAFIVAIVVWLSRRRLSPRGELAIAVQRREFIVHYQPIIELKTGLCIGAEALVRWQRPGGTLVRPDLFIPLAEESGLILPITDQVVEAMIADLGALLVRERRLHIAVNLSADDIKTGRILDFIRFAAADTGIRPQQIWLEATERGFMDVAAARETLDQARECGHAVAIDDFGTGYSSLSYLQDLPLDALKIDKSFIDTIGTDSATSSVTPHIIDMAQTLKLKIIAEGIETRAQADYLLARGVDYGQGWLFSKALPAREFIAFYHRNKSDAQPQPVPQPTPPSAAPSPA